MKYARQCSRGSRTPVTLRWTDQYGLDWTGETGRDETCEARKHGVLCAGWIVDPGLKPPRTNKTKKRRHWSLHRSGW